MAKEEKLKYPKGETVWVSYRTTKNETRFILTSKSDDRSWYFLYELQGDTFKKLGKSKSPYELEEKFNVNARLRGK